LRGRADHSTKEMEIDEQVAIGVRVKHSNAKCAQLDFGLLMLWGRMVSFLVRVRFGFDASMSRTLRGGKIQIRDNALDEHNGTDDANDFEPLHKGLAVAWCSAFSELLRFGFRHRKRNLNDEQVTRGPIALRSIRSALNGPLSTET